MSDIKKSTPLAYPEPAATPDGDQNLIRNAAELLNDIGVELEVIVGKSSLSAADIFALKTGAVLSLNKSVADPVAVLLNGKVVAEGQLVAVEDSYGVRITRVAAFNGTPS